MSEKKQKEYDPTKAPFSWDKLRRFISNIKLQSLIVCSDYARLPVKILSIKNHIKKKIHGITFTEYARFRKLSRTKVKIGSKSNRSKHWLGKFYNC